MKNTSAHVFKEPTDQQLYVFVSGQWFRAWTTDGPWQHLPNDALPADLAKVAQGLVERTGPTMPSSGVSIGGV